MKTKKRLKEFLLEENNDYSGIEKIFYKETKLDFLSGYRKGILITKKCSIIIPFYKNIFSLEKTLIFLDQQNLSSAFKRNNMEIIIVNDGARIDCKNTLKKTCRSYSTKYLKFKCNQGRASARNLGLAHSSNEIVFFLDEDMLLPQEGILNQLLRHEFSEKCAIVGFRENISLNLFNSLWTNQKIIMKKFANYKRDFRFKKFVPIEWKSLYREVPEENFNKTYSVFKESAAFRDFGSGKVIGVWSLPFMFLSSNASVPRKYLIEVGGFDDRFKGWGMEDVHLGAKLIAKGLYIVPNLNCTAFHLVERTSEEKLSERLQDYARNLSLYYELQNDPLVSWEENEWKRKTLDNFANKFEIYNL